MALAKHGLIKCRKPQREDAKAPKIKQVITVNTISTIIITINTIFMLLVCAACLQLAHWMPSVADMVRLRGLKAGALLVSTSQTHGSIFERLDLVVLVRLEHLEHLLTSEYAGTALLTALLASKACLCASLSAELFGLRIGALEVECRAVWSSDRGLV